MVCCSTNMKDLEFMRIWDRYSPLLTRTQREMTDLYFNYDLSLTEIAEEKGCSKQGVSDCLNICRKKLEEYEQKLGFAEQTVRVKEALGLFAKRNTEHAEEILKIADLLDGKGGEE